MDSVFRKPSFYVKYSGRSYATRKMPLIPGGWLAVDRRVIGGNMEYHRLDCAGGSQR